MIRDGLCRGRINKDVGRVKRMFKWAASKKLVPLEVHLQLQTLEGLRAGRTAARESGPVRLAEREHVEAVLPYLLPQTRALVELQLSTGMRPGEAVVLRGADLDTSGPVWLYRPGSDRGPHGSHKTAWRGRDRVVAVGPRGQAVLRPWLRDDPAEYLFQPSEARAHFDAERRRRRKTPLTPSQARRRPKAAPRRAPGDRYSNASYARAVAAACARAGVPPWSPNRLRHTFATEVRRQRGLEAAQAALGHARADVTELYAERDLALARAVAAEMG
jgi:integrase